jgi:hypothetical protein
VPVAHTCRSVAANQRSNEQRMDRSDPKLSSDGRHMRSERTRQALVKAYLDLLIERQKPPTAPEIAKRAGCSMRSVFERFSDLLTLSLAAADYAYAQAMAQSAAPDVDADLDTRIKAQVETRAAICEKHRQRHLSKKSEFRLCSIGIGFRGVTTRQSAMVASYDIWDQERAPLQSTRAPPKRSRSPFCCAPRDSRFSRVERKRIDRGEARRKERPAPSLARRLS